MKYEKQYKILKTDLQNREIFAELITEEPSISWFVSDGTIEDEITWPQNTKTLDTVYVAPEEAPETPGGMVTVWMVARDLRGGLEWQSLQIRVVEE